MRLIALLCLAIALPVAAEEVAGFTVGEALTHTLSVCLKKEDAIEIVNADAENGLEAAQAVWAAKSECATAPVFGYVVGNVVHSASVSRPSGRKLTASVVEIRGEGGAVVGYFLSTKPVDPAPKAGEKAPPHFKTENAI